MPPMISNRSGSVITELHHRSQQTRSSHEWLSKGCLQCITSFSQNDQHADIRRPDVLRGRMAFSAQSFIVSLLLIIHRRYPLLLQEEYSAVTRFFTIAYAPRLSSHEVTRPHSARYHNWFSIQLLSMLNINVHQVEPSIAC
jgi:hypothetical protein